jgi:hypothetical protein
MDCLQCGTWNPDDRVRCWRCQAQLPEPPAPRKPRTSSSMTWIWITAVLLFLFLILVQCGVLRIGQAPDLVGFLAGHAMPHLIGACW